MNAPIKNIFYRFVSHFGESLAATIRQRQCSEKVIMELLVIEYGSIKSRVTNCLRDIPEGLDKRILVDYLSSQFGDGNISPTLDYLSSILPYEAISPWILNELINRAQLAVLAHHKWLLKTTYDNSKISLMVKATGASWVNTGDVNTPWIYFGKECILESKVCAYPFEPLYAIYMNGYVNDWPGAWNRQEDIDKDAALSLTAPRRNIFQQIADEYVNGQWMNEHPLGELKFEVTGGGNDGSTL
jgi:hypothetical protein